MATIQRFEDLEIWQSARQLSQKIYHLTFREPLRSDFRLREQMRGSSGSIMDNIAEGFERGSRLEFINFSHHSKSRIGELKSQLYRALDNHYLHREKFEELYTDANLLTKKTTNFVAYLNNSKIKGQKFKNRVI